MDLSELLRALLAGDADGAVSIARANPRVAAGVLERYVNDVVPWSNRCDPSENPVGLPGALAPIGPCGEQGPPFRPPFDPFMEHLTRGHLGLGDAAGALHVALLHLDREDARARVHALLRTMCCVEASWPVEKEAQADHVLTPEEEAQISEARENHGIWGAWIHDVVRGTDAWGERVAPATIIDVLDAVGDKSTIRLAYRAVRCQPDWEWNGVRPLLDWVLRHRDADAVVELVRDDWAGTLFGYAELRPSLRSGRLARLNHRLYRKGVISRDEYIRNAKTMQENRTTR